MTEACIYAAFFRYLWLPWDYGTMVLNLRHQKCKTRLHILQVKYICFCFLVLNSSAFIFSRENFLKSCTASFCVCAVVKFRPFVQKILFLHPHSIKLSTSLVYIGLMRNYLKGYGPQPQYRIQGVLQWGEVTPFTNKNISYFPEVLLPILLMSLNVQA